MYFSRSFVASVLLGLATATTHAGEGVAAVGTSTSALVASETLASAASAVSAAATPPAAGQVATHVIQVGGDNATLRFLPNNIQANPGDLVQFQFNPKNHSVVQSTFDQPCIPIQNIQANKTDAFFSGFKSTNASQIATEGKLTYTIRVMDTKPIWFYCSQGMHCQAGMVGAINAPASGNKTIDAFVQLAGAATENLTPGQQPGTGAVAPPAASSGAAVPPGGEGTPAATGGATGSSAANPAQQTTNAAPGRVSQSFLGLGLGGLAAFALL